MDPNPNKRTASDRSPPMASSMPAAKQARLTSPSHDPAAPPDTADPGSSQDIPTPGDTFPSRVPQAPSPPKYGPATYSRSGVVNESIPGSLAWGLHGWFAAAKPERTRLGYSKLLQRMVTSLRAFDGLNMAPSPYFLDADATALSSILENDLDFERELSQLYQFIETLHQDGAVVTSSIRRILNHVCAPATQSEPDVSPHAKRNAEYVKKAWEAPFAGTADVRLLQGLRSSFENGPLKGADYSNNVSMLQGSGTGKTRSADKISHLVFTFAVVLREDARAGEFPAADSSVRDLLTGPSETLMQPHVLYPGRYRRFLKVLFKSATRWIQGQKWTQTAQPLAYLEKTNGWKSFLDSNREAIYDAVVGVVKESERRVRGEEDEAKEAYTRDRATGLDPKEAQLVYEKARTNIHGAWLDDGSYAARDALRKLRRELETIGPTERIPPHDVEVSPIFTSTLSTSQLSSVNSAAETALSRWTDDVWPKTVTVSADDLAPHDSKLTVLVYFDEAHTLCVDNQGHHAKTHYDYLLSVLHEMLKDIMGLFLSTSSRLRQLAPHAALSASARQAQSKLLQPPLTELPFDCKAAAVATRVLTLAEVSSIRFLANFGRPLFWSVFPEYDTMDKGQKTDVEDYIVQLTEAKLIGIPPGDPDLRWDVGPENGQIAVIDVRIWIDYEPRKSTADGTEADLVATHMRLVFTVPLNREYFYSGYSSEPMLAEAAARLMRRWMWGASARAWNPVHTLGRLLQKGLLDRGERGELVARFLLTLAYDNAVRGRGEICSVGCTVSAFFTALFRHKFAQRVLAAKPDNVVVQDDEALGEDAETLGEDAEMLGEDAQTLGQAAEALGHVVETLEQSLGSGIVRFTHFVKLDDESGLTTRGLCAAFIRGAAFIAQPSQTKVDAILPVLLDPTKPITPQNMSAILVQIKLRVRAGTPADYDFTAEQLGLFKDSDPQDKTHPLRQRPYITLLMELGVKVASSERKAGSKARANAKGKGKKTTGAAKPKTKASAPPKWLSNVDVATAPMRASTRKPGKDAPAKPLKHPRFNIRAYGCSSNVYKVIEEKDNSNYSSILLANQKWEEDHPRRDLRDCVARMLPTWSADNAYGWVPDKPMRDVDRAKGKKEEVVSGEQPSERADASDDGDDDDDDDDDEDT